jgi:hypothetical protein
MQRAQVKEAPSRAEALVDELNARWKGHEACDEGPVIIDRIELVSPPATWPPRLRIWFTVAGRRGVWERDWDLGYLIDNGPVSSAADWFARIAWTPFLEMQDTESRPRGLRFLDE